MGIQPIKTLKWNNKYAQVQDIFLQRYNAIRMKHTIKQVSIRVEHKANYQVHE